MIGRPKKADASLVILEVSPHAAKVMIATQAPLQIQQVNASLLSGQTDDAVAATRALLDAQTLSTQPVGLLFGREMFSLRTLELPSIDPKEIASMLELQLGKLTPYPRAEILSSWAVIGTFREGYTSVLLAIARKTLIQDVLQLLKTKHITPQWVGVSTEGLEAWWQAAARLQAAGAADALTVLIDIDATSTDCTVLSAQNQLLFTHSITIGAEQLSASEPSKLRWVGELVRLPRILSHEDVKGRISRGLLTGVTEGLEPLIEQLTSQWGVPVEVKDSLSLCGHSPMVSQSARASRVSYTALAGTVIRGTPPRIDLIPQETRVSQALHVRSQHLARLAGSLAIILVLGVVLYVERILILRHYLIQLQQRLSAIEQISSQVLQRQEAMRKVRGWLEPSRSVLEVFRGVASAVDAGITITQIALEEGKPVTIRGRAGTMGGAFEFVERLKRQGTFATIQPKSVAKAKGAGEEGAEFELVCEFPTSSS